MLVISRRDQERFFIDVAGERIVVQVIEIVRGNRVRLGINASKSVAIYREEIAPAERPAVLPLPDPPRAV